MVAAAALLGTGSLAFGPAELAVDPVLITPSTWRADPGTRAGAAATAAAQEWLDSGRVPGRGTRWEGMAEVALADLRELVRPNGAVLAGAADRWEYVWPRDSAFVAVALAEAGHPQEAARVLGFLDTLPLDGKTASRRATTSTARDRPTTASASSTAAAGCCGRSSACTGQGRPRSPAGSPVCRTGAPRTCWR